MTGRAVVITGGAGGIGRGMAACFARLGDTVFIADNNLELGEKAAAELGARFHETDVRSEESVSNLMQRAKRYNGWINVVIANAGFNDGLGTSAVDSARWESSIRINLTSVYYTCRAALPYISDGGRIIIISSLVGLVGQRNSAAYAAAKGGLIAYVKALALELAPRKIAVNAIAPGDVKTPAYDRWLTTQPPETLDAIVARIPLGRFASPEEVGALAVFLASSEAGFITGQTIVIDGGKSLGQ